MNCYLLMDTTIMLLLALLSDFQLKSSKPLPVIVFLFGGGFERGDPTRDLHGPDYFMMKPVILITLSYRLGPFGKYIFNFVLYDFLKSFQNIYFCRLSKL